MCLSFRTLPDGCVEAGRDFLLAGVIACERAIWCLEQRGTEICSLSCVNLRCWLDISSTSCRYKPLSLSHVRGASPKKQRNRTSSSSHLLTTPGHPVAHDVAHREV
jgi:hypothetical protein